MAGQTGARTGTGAPAAGASAGYFRAGRAAAIATWLRARLFIPTTGRVGWRQFTGGAVFLVAGAAASLARTGGPGALNTIWIEDATNLLTDALNRPVMTALTTQINGYYETVPRLVTAFAMLFPLENVPGIMSASAALVYAMTGLIAYTASGPHLRSPWLRLLVAAPACVIPLAYTQADNDLVTAQFFALYACFWIFLWMPRTVAGRVGSPVIMLGVALTSILPVLFAPLVVLRLIADRSRHTIVLAICWAAGLVAQFSLQLRGMSNRQGASYTSPLWVIGQYATRAVPRALFGEDALGGPGVDADGRPVPLAIHHMATHDALIWGAWLLVAAAIVIALTRLTAPNWPLAIAAFGFSLLIFVGEIVDNLRIVQPRYVIAPALLLYAGLAALLRPDPGPPRRKAAVAWCPVVVFALVLATAIGFNYRVTNGRTTGPSWSETIAAAQRLCGTPKGVKYLEHHIGSATYLYHHVWWKVYIPCSKVRP